MLFQRPRLKARGACSALSAVRPDGRQAFFLCLKISLAREPRHSSSSDGLFLCCVSGSKASIFVRKTLLVRPRDQQCVCVAKLAGQDQRFSMKMMFAPDHGTGVLPALTNAQRYDPPEIKLFV